MDYILMTGVIGSIILVTGAAWPDSKSTRKKNTGLNLRALRSIKNWLFTFGGLVMFAYALLNYQQGGPFFFVILQVFILISSVMMMLDIPDKIDVPIIVAAGAGLVAWSFFLFEGWTTVIFIVGLCGVGLGYALQAGTMRRNIALTTGSILIALYSYIESNWIYFWINAFFTVFSAYWIYIGLKKHAKK